MKLFNFIAVHPVQVPPCDLPQVCKKNFLVFGDDIAKAFKEIAEYDEVTSAREVWGAECAGGEGNAVLVTPDTKIALNITQARHDCWIDMQERYVRLDDAWKSQASESEDPQPVNAA